MFRRGLYLLTISAVFGVAGCSSLLTSGAPPETVYWLDAAPVTAVDSADAPDASIRVAVTAAPGLDVDRIMVRGPGTTLNEYAGARWPDHIPEVLEVLVRTALEDSGLFRQVMSRRSGTRADWDLALELRSFYARVSAGGAPPSVQMEMRGYIRCSAQVFPLEVGASRASHEDSLTGITAAFQAVVDDALSGLPALLPASCDDR